MSKDNKKNRDVAKLNIKSKLKSVVKGKVPDGLLPAKDNYKRRCRTLGEELEAMIKELEEQELSLPDAPPYMDDAGEKELEQIIEKEKEQKEDRAVWKAYSKRGGISDILMDIRKAVESPSANAFEFDEEEGMYVIFITLNNTYISRLTFLCSEVGSECERIRKAENSEVQKERKELQAIYQKLLKLSEMLFSFPRQWECVSHTKKEELEKKLKELEKNLNSYKKEREAYADEVEAYQKQLVFFKEKCEQQKSYTLQYDKLLEELTRLGKIGKEEHTFHMLTVSPEGEEELRQYMDMADKFNEWASQITDEYSL